MTPRRLTRALWGALAFAASVFLGLTSARAGGQPLDGRSIVAGAECAACHAVPDVAAPIRTASCTGCHQWVKTVSANPAQRAKAMQIFPKWARYEHNVKSYFAVPNLEVAFARLDPAWMRTYLADPYDIRPTMDEGMVRLGLNAAQIDAVVAWASTQAYKPAPSPAPSAANVPKGEALFAERGCVACHTFGKRHLGPGIPAAPDLRWARDRMTDDMLAAWIQDPTAISPKTTMPKLGLTAAEAVALRDYLVLANPDAPGAVVAAAPAGATATTAAVAAPRWDDVEARVFGKICIHCHMDPAQNEGRAGPGNAGGFGWPATGIELQTYEGVVAHKDQILAAIARRNLEDPRDHVAPGEVPANVKRPELPGMPLGQPALPEADQALVRAWFAAGAPR